VVVFVLQTILVPLGVIWLLWRLSRMLVTGLGTGVRDEDDDRPGPPSTRPTET